MKIDLMSVSMRNFKNQRKTTIDFKGRSACVFGKNRLGKTTIGDAVFWVLFDKNLTGKTDFEVKPYGLDRPETEVSVTLRFDDRELSFKRIQVERWTKRRNEAQETFAGNESKYFINDIEKSKGDFKAFLDSRISEATFRRLTSAEYFFGLKKPEQRKILVEMCGAIPNSDILMAKPELQGLVDLMFDKGYSIEDVLKLAKQNKMVYEAEQQTIATRIDEARRTIPEEQDYAAIEANLEKANYFMSIIDSRLNDWNTMALESKKQVDRLSMLQKNAEDYKRNRLSILSAGFYKAQDDKRSLEFEASSIKKAIYNRDTDRKRLADRLAGTQTYLEKYRLDYENLLNQKKDILSKQPEELSEDAKLCVTCGQALPEDKLKAVIVSQKNKFKYRVNQEIAFVDKKMEEVAYSAEQEKVQAAATEQHMAELDLSDTTDRERLSVIASEIARLDTWMMEHPIADDVDLSQDEEYMDLQKAIEQQKDSILKPDDSNTKLRDQKFQLTNKIQEFKIILSKKGDKEKAEARIAELMERGRALTGMVAEQINLKAMCEVFIREKASRLQNNINAMFSNLEFRLFDVLINGEVVDDCTPMIDGVEYKDASNSERIRASMDIIAAFQKSEGIYPFCIVDNAEAANYLRDMDCQTIKLYVSEDSKLRIELEEQEEQTVASIMPPNYSLEDYENLLGGFAK